MNMNIYETIQDLKSRVRIDENKIVELQQTKQENINKIRQLEALLENTFHAAELIMNDTSKSSASTSSASTSLEEIEKAPLLKQVCNDNDDTSELPCKPKKIKQKNYNKHFMATCFKHKMVFRASRLHRQDKTQRITVDVVFNSDRQKFFDRNTGIEYATLNRAATKFGELQSGKNVGSAWDLFKALNVVDNTTVAMEHVHEIENYVSFIDADFVFNI